ncbi:hypothetical protein KC318_g6550 [Hortaea werneckii]|nr:hypothetical protein KC324_g9364 [Hortaea werneckii]KAI7580992.1 hypothetical protein KC316_g8686 [Hortaea werneckii]KAI7666390.1 hypothetical protein KC318_g6550 [Hortaea werneckii]
MLLRTTSVASSCWPNNPFDSTVSCNDVKANWSSTAFHAERPESLDYPISANSSCIPPGATGYEESRGCDLGLPDYILNATINEEVATALQFASERNIRIVVKGTGHDMNGSAISGSGNAGSASLMSSRLLRRKELAQTPKDDVIGYLKTACLGQNATHGSYVTVGMQGGLVMSNISQTRWWYVSPVWRSTYVHMIATGADFKAGTDEGPMKQLTLAGDWINQTKESMWQQWAPDTGAYANEANPFIRNWKHDFYGPSYDRLLDIKQKYDPSFSMFVYNGVGTESWAYDLNSGVCIIIDDSEYSGGIRTEHLV